MAWQEYYPVLTEEQVEDGMANATAEEREEFEDLFAVDKIVGQQKAKPHVLSVSLFFKNILQTQGDITTVTEGMLRNPTAFGIECRYNPWQHYVEPILKLAPRIAEKFPQVTLRVYLAKDLDFLAEELSKCAQVYIMRSASDRAAPGMLWRYLAVEDAESYCTILDSDMLAVAGEKIVLTEKLKSFGCACWRCPVVMDWMDKRIAYRPMAGGYWGANIKLPMRKLLMGFWWNLRTGRLSKWGTHPKSGKTAEIFGAKWPDYGVDEYFLATTLFPRLAAGGALTIVSHLGKSWFLPLDIEYVTWLNRASSVEYSLFWNVVRPDVVTKLSKQARCH